MAEVNKVVIFGAGQIAEVVRFYLEHDSKWRVAGFAVDSDNLKQSTLDGLPVVPTEDIVTEFPSAEFRVFVALSYARVNQLRASKLAALEQLGYSAISYVSSKASVWPGLVVHPNTLILEHNTIQPYARVGRDVIMWSGNHIGHHSNIGDHVFVASHAVVSGAVSIGDYSFVGVNATIRDNVTIGRSCVIGAGALILADAQDEQVFMGQTTQASRVPSSRLRRI